MHFDVVIVGGGHGGAQAAQILRQKKFEGSIAIIGDEPELPYERPPLSKEYLAGEKAFERILIRPASFWSERKVEMILSKRVTAVNPVSHSLTTHDGEHIGYGKLIWSAGGTPRRLTCVGSDATGVHSIRTRQDIDALMAELPFAQSVVVIGGGYIGLEAAAVLQKLGKKVVLLEALDRVLARVAGEPLSRFFEREHRAHGVDLRTSTAMDRIEIKDGRACGVTLVDGSTIACDMVIVGIGIIPETGPLADAGARVGNGVEVDEYCRTSLSDIYAIGDCAAHGNRFAEGATIRLESVQNASDQAKTCVMHMIGEPVSYEAVPWFWSNQYDLRLQTVGLSTGYDNMVLRGEPKSRSFSLVYLKQGKVIALDCVNMVKDYVQGRSLVVEGIVSDGNRLADVSIPLNHIVQRN